MVVNDYIDDLSALLNSAGAGCTFNGVSMTHLLYVDDTCVIAPSPAGLQILLDICSSYAASHTLIFNESKTKCLCIKPKSLKDLFIPSVYLKGKALTFVHVQKYLGIFLDDTMSDKPDIARHVKGIYTRGNLLLNRFRHCSDDVKNSLFKTFCSNAYGSVLWSKYSTNTLQRCIVAFNDVYRFLFKSRRGVSISQIYVTNGIDSFNIYRRKNIYSFRQRLFKSENLLIQTIVHSDYFNSSPITDKWHSVLYL